MHNLIDIKLCPAYAKCEALQRLNNLRGIFAIEIVIAHLVRDEKTILYPFRKFAIISVAFFFFTSALGMIVSYEKKENYLYGFLVRNPLYLFVLALFVYLYNAIVSALAPVNLNYLPICFGNFFKCTNWYIWEQIVFYLLFYFVYRYCKRRQILIVSVVSVMSAVILFVLGVPECWYASSFAFPLGLLIGKYYRQFVRFLNSFEGILLIVLLTLFGFVGLILPQDSLIGMVFARNAICIAFLLILLQVLSRYRIGDNRIIDILGKYSVEIYLFQFIYLSISASYRWNDNVINMLFVIFADLLTALIMHPITERIRNRIKKLIHST